MDRPKHIKDMAPSGACEELARLQEADDRRADRILVVAAWVFVALLGVALIAAVSR